MQCDTCGKETQLFKTLIEGTELNVCKPCSRFGKVLEKAKSKAEIIEEKAGISEVLQKKQEESREPIEKIVDNYSEIIRDKRKELGIKQKDLAMMLSEKESVISKMEAGSFKPSIKLARKLEKKLGLFLVEKIKVEKVELEKTEGKALTIGDLIKRR